MATKSERRFPRALRRLDAAAGTRLERLVMAKHERRLRRLAQLEALRTPAGDWARTGLPPRAGNRVDVLVDGAQALPAIAAAIREARSSVWVAGWFFSADFRLRSDSSETLGALLAETAERVEVRLLGWAGAPLPLFHPDRKDVRAVRDALTRNTRVRFALDARERPLHCHHEKLVIVDSELAFVGGIDLTSYAGDRLDTNEHPARGSLGWHDAACRIRGPAVSDIAGHFRMRWREVTGEELPARPPHRAADDVELQVVRTVPERIYERLPRGEFTILESYLRAVGGARRLVYLENQFLWSPEIVSALAQKLRDPPDGRFRLLVLLPAKPNNGNDDTRGQLGPLAAADDGRGRFLACTLYQRGPNARPIYVHAKVAIVDDTWLTIGSANLNEHSLFNDTELNVVSRDPALAKETRLRLWSEHLERPVAELDADPTEIVDTSWKPLAQEQRERRAAGQPLTHKLLALPHVSRRTDALRGPSTASSSTADVDLGVRVAFAEGAICRSMGGRSPERRARFPLEIAVIWALLLVVTVEVLVTYSRVPAVALYHVSGSGLSGGASRALVLLNFPVALVAIPILALIADRLRSRPAQAAALIGVVLCAAVFWPGVVSQANLDARPVNAVAAFGVLIAIALTVFAAGRLQRPARPARQPGDALRLVLAVPALAVGPPWMAADLGFFLNGVPGLGRLFQSGPYRHQVPGLPSFPPAVHHGHHHGMDGILLVLASLLLSRLLGDVSRGWLRSGLTAYLALMVCYGVGNIANDFWTEQVVERGWTSWQIPNVLEPRVTIAWGIILLCAAALWALTAGGAPRTRARRGR